MTVSATRLALAEQHVRALYASTSVPLPFNGWPHVDFVRREALRFAPELKADLAIVELVALTHDLNYLVKADSTYDVGRDLRIELFAKLELDQLLVDRLERIIQQADIAYRVKHMDETLSSEAMALSDGDSAFKALPQTPIVFGSRYLQQKNTSLQALAQFVLATQEPLIARDLFFYSETAKQDYQAFIEHNMQLFKNVLAQFANPRIPAVE